MTALNKQARLVSSTRISEIANGANLIMGEKEWLANTAIYLANELKTATKAFQSTGFSLLEAEEKLEAAEKRIAELEARTVTLPQYRNSPDMHTKQFYEVIGFNQGLDIFIEALRAAGIGVKGE
ncbi:hypothetical protein [Citrobacter portucalensis]|uniref:hypothetical protein n=1 Tax=Citrobacter portucalensis TaxID=1639133 RepID=UPI000F6C637F|nr:hypothetical protein [Citrobacter portucalensis]VEC16567.1 Uncharacterised protein [Citrobacter portucalensis]